MEKDVETISHDPQNPSIIETCSDKDSKAEMSITDMDSVVVYGQYGDEYEGW